MGRKKHRQRPCDPAKFQEKKLQSNGDGSPIRGAGYKEIVKENPLFEKYYKQQKIIPDEEEWFRFLSALREPLPTTFRITGFRSETRVLVRKVEKDYLKQLLQVDPELAESLRIKPLPWYPERLAWQLNQTRQILRRSPHFARLHLFLTSETECGAISRQEAVSMIPPLLMDVKSHHKILDMCASPGSKTSQLLEMLHAEEDGIPSGCVIANDIDNGRCYMLTTQVKRLQSPCLMITNQNAAEMPEILVPTAEGGALKPLKFDRILCDVPCSGDGTMRKNVIIWKKWNFGAGVNRHGIQFRIARRGVELLEENGLLVYSTCSMNPIENEAVVARILQEFPPGQLELVSDVAKKLPGLISAPGLSSWTPMGRQGEKFDRFEDIPESYHTLIHPHLFPPKDETIRESLHLDRCVRVYPHHQDTGGFFIAVIRKLPSSTDSAVTPAEDGGVPAELSSSPSSKKAKLEVEESTSESAEGRSKRDKGKKGRKFKGYKEDPFIYLRPDDAVYSDIKSHYGISDLLDPTLLLVRSEGGKRKNIYMTNRMIKNVIVNNEKRLKIINGGVKVFARADSKNTECDFRLAQEGIKIISLFIAEDTVRTASLDLEDTISLLRKISLEDPLWLSDIRSDEARQKLTSIANGSVLLTYRGDEEDGGGSLSPLVLNMVGWKGQNTLRAYIGKSERIHYLRLIGADLQEYEESCLKKKQGDVQLREERALKDSMDNPPKESEQQPDEGAGEDDPGDEDNPGDEEKMETLEEQN
ncbi:unnamed protein product [Cyprideis torosa]|uniref:tRNA (cytosine(34)-C(5))-methyltransferase n=1 Tax=Cyprideis torosa TaxID=163714 RepID=A0A7R8ZJF7_9CRUS|nr:unnamed protein product [Cyprideis torosa]CAG0879719.1 unnamed protein product [Cyprideis torosa]